MWQTGGCYASLFSGFSPCLRNARRRRKGGEEGHGPNTSGVGIQLKTVL